MMTYWVLGVWLTILGFFFASLDWCSSEETRIEAVTLRARLSCVDFYLFLYVRYRDQNPFMMYLLWCIFKYKKRPLYHASSYGPTNPSAVLVLVLVLVLTLVPVMPVDYIYPHKLTDIASTGLILFFTTQAPFATTNTARSPPDP